MELKKYLHLDLPDIDKYALQHVRICSQCMNKVPKSRKPPCVRESVSVKHCSRPTREALCQAIAHDHSYALPSTTSSTWLSAINEDHHLSLISTTNTTDEVPLTIPSPSVPLVERFGIELFINDNQAISFYTAFPSYAHFMTCFNFLGNAVNHLKYPDSNTDEHSIGRVKSQRVLSPQNEFFLTLCRLRCGLMELDLAYRFHISQPTVSRIFKAWLNLLYYKLREIPIWPSRTQVDSLMPNQFKVQYPNTRIIIDATEIYIQRPSDPYAQQLTFSSYKNHNTAKALAGITPSGAFSFVSPLYGGSISDRELFIQSGLLEKLEQGDAVMADKGFNIADLLETKGVSLNIPPRKNSEQFDSIELVKTRRIASLRVHIERAFGRVKSFKILSSIPNNMAGYASELFITCAILTNFQPPLIIDKK